VAIGNQGTKSIYSVIVRSFNAGYSWNTVSILNDDRLLDVAVGRSNLNFLAVSENGKILHSDDDGESWEVKTASQALLNGVSIGSNGNAFVVGIIDKTAAIYYSSNNSQYSVWTQANILNDTSSQFYGVSTFDGIHAVAVGGSGTIFHSNDAGKNWVLSLNSLTVCDGLDFYSISVFLSTPAFAGGVDGCLVKSMNGGVSWTRIKYAAYFDSIDFQYHSVSVQSSKVIFATGINRNAGSEGKIFKSLDGGNSWSVDFKNMSDIFFQSLLMFEYQIGVAGAQSNKIFVRSPGPTQHPTGMPSSQPSYFPSSNPTQQPFISRQHYLQCNHSIFQL